MHRGCMVHRPETVYFKGTVPFVLTALPLYHYGPRFQALSDPDEQYNTFLHILDQYLLPTSPNEVNASGTSSKRVAAFLKR